MVRSGRGNLGQALDPVAAAPWRETVKSAVSLPHGEYRAQALNLMENIESDQQAGIGDTAPVGSTVAMKDGWVPGPDDLWAMNTSGIVTVGKETYILSVYTQEQASLDDGQAIARHVCSTIASLLP